MNLNTKKLLLTLSAIVTFSVTAFCQCEKGTKLIGGESQLNISSSKRMSNGSTTSRGKLVSGTISNKFGYFLFRNFVAGTELAITGENWKPEDDDINDQSKATFLFGPFVRYYFPVRLFIEGKYMIGLSEIESQRGFDFSKREYKHRHAAIAIGYAKFLNDAVAIEPMLGYESVAEKPRFDSSVTDIRNSLFLRLGVQVYLQ